MRIHGKQWRGFTLVEVVITLVVLGIVAGVLAPVIAQAFRSYSDTKARADLMARGRLALERLAREVRHAVPNSLETLTVGGSAVGIEFVRSSEGGRYVATGDALGGAFRCENLRFPSPPGAQGPVCTSVPSCAAVCTGSARTGLYVMGTGLGYGAGDLLVIANTSPDDLRSGRTAAALSATPEATSGGQDGTDQGSILRFDPFTFQNRSPGRHYHIADVTVEVGLAGGALRWFEGPGLDAYDGAADWSAADPMLVDGVTGVRFTYEPGTPAASGVLQVELDLAARGESINLYEEIHVRNTP